MRLSCGSQSCVPSSEQESCTMCSNSTPCWSATDAMQSLSQFELRKLGVTMENFTAAICPFGAGQENDENARCVNRSAAIADHGQISLPCVVGLGLAFVFNQSATACELLVISP